MFYIVKGGWCPLYPLVLRSGSILCLIRSCRFYHLPDSALIYIAETDYAISSDVSKGLGQGGVLAWSGDITSRLPEQVEPGAIFPLRALDSDLVRQHPGPPDATVCGLHQIDGDPTIDVSAHPGVGLPPLCCKEAGYLFQGIQRLHTEYPINGGDKGRKNSTSLEACLFFFACYSS